MSRPLKKKGLNSKAIKGILMHCPCGKLRAKSLAEAKSQHQSAVARHGHNNEVRFYQCSVYGNWHWSSQISTVDPEGRPWLSVAEQHWNDAQKAQ